jgi:class 3 adenylate cyclase
MLGSFVFRLLLLLLCLGGILLVDSYIYVNQIMVLDENEPASSPENQFEKVLEAYKTLVKSGTKLQEDPRIPLNGRSYAVYLTADESGYLIEKNGVEVPIVIDEDSGNYCLELEGGEKIFAMEFSPMEILWQDSFLRRFHLLYILVALLILGSLKDLFSQRKSGKSPSSSSTKDRQKQSKKCLKSIETYLKAGKSWKLQRLLEDPQTSQQITKDLERGELVLGQAWLYLQEKDKALPPLRRYASRFRKDPEIGAVLAEYFSSHPKDARIQDLPYLLPEVENSQNIDLLKFVASLILRHKISDRKTIHALCKICATDAGTPEIREYGLSILMKYEDMDEVAEEFYELCAREEPENPGPVLMLAEAKLSTGRFDDALDHLETLLNLDYDNQKVHDMLFTIYQLKERLVDLYAIYESVLEQYPEEPIAVSQQRKIQGQSEFVQDPSNSQKNMSLEDLLAMRKKGDSSADSTIMKKYEKLLTIMFTDIEGYTKMTASQSIVETMATLQESDEILPPIIEKHEGTVIKKIGDAFMARFDSADSALIAGVQIQQALHANNRKRQETNKAPWNIRIGLNTGPVIIKDEDIFGDAVNVASRVESNAESGEVYCTEDTVQASNHQSLKFELRDSRKVKGKTEPINLYALVFNPSE